MPNPKLKLQLSSDKIVLFLHLLGIDTNGHSHKPYSDEYLKNIGTVDSGIRDIVERMDDLYEHDGKTAYVLTADHGMTNWGMCMFSIGLCVDNSSYTGGNSKHRPILGLGNILFV